MRTYNIKEAYLDYYNPWLVILAEATFAILSKQNRLNSYIPGQLAFGYDMILLIKHKMDLGLILQRNQTQIYKHKIRVNSKRVYHDYKVRYKIILNNNAA